MAHEADVVRPMTDTNASLKACANTDRELWREREGDYYADSIHVTAHGGIGINCGGTVIVKPLREWHQLAIRTPPESSEPSAGEWQPIETAPTTEAWNEAVLVYVPTATEADERVMVARHWGVWSTVEDGNFIDPTHWMPLPTPPVQP